VAVVVVIAVALALALALAVMMAGRSPFSRQADEGARQGG